MEDVAEEVDGGAVDGLRGEEVVGLEGDAGVFMGGEGGGGREHGGEVLDEKGEVRVGGGEGVGDVAVGAADIDDGGLGGGGA